MPADAPSVHAAAGDVARADDHVGAIVQGAHEVGEVLGIVREVRVHLEEALVPLGEALREAVHVRRSEPELAGAVHHADAAVARGDLVGELARAVGRVVVDDENVRLRRGCSYLVQEPR